MASNRRSLRLNERLGLSRLPISKTKRQHEDHTQQEQAKKRVVLDDVTNRKTKKKSLLKKKKTVTDVIPPPRKATIEAEQTANSCDTTNDSIPSSQSSTTSQQSIKALPSITEEDIRKLKVENIRLSIDGDECLEEVESFEWEDVDKAQINDVFYNGLYAAHIFEYYKERETKFIPSDYISTNKGISANIRTVLVDWMVEIQENFELNHETLYLGVKMLDSYLSKKVIAREMLQLLGATCMFIASKYDERMPPLLDDFLYICNDIYKRHQLISMELDVLKSLNFDIGMPLSYRFLRRYAKCAKDEMPMLALARYILEVSLMDYSLIFYRDSQIAASALLLAHAIEGKYDWSGTMRHYTGYKKEELQELVRKLNSLIIANKSSKYKNVREKYSHSVFHCAAKKPTLTERQLQSLFEPANQEIVRK